MSKRPTAKKRGKQKGRVDLTPAKVLETLYDLGFHRTGQLVTTDMVAHRLDVKVEKLAPVLKVLKRQNRIYRRRRENKVVWFPARGQRAKAAMA